MMNNIDDLKGGTLNTGTRPTAPKPDANASSVSRTSPPDNAASSSAPMTAGEQARKQYNAAILQANYEVSLSARNEPQALVYKAAIEAINEELRGTLGDDAIQRAADEGLDVSPEATAKRIVDFSTGLFDLYRQSNPDLSQQEQLDRFLEVIGGGVETGFGEAREILDGLGVLEGEIETNVDRTFELVQEGLAAFRERIEALINPEDESAASE